MSVDTDERRVALVGLMGAGKSRVGTLLGAALRWPFVDADRLIEEQTGRSISDIFREDGEPHFRELEHRAVAELARRPPPLVLATGGGVIETAANRDELAKSFLVIWIRLDPLEAARRVRGRRGKRPLLAGPHPETVLQELATRRHPLYQSVADHTVTSTRETRPEDLRDVILDILESLPR